MNKNLIAIVRNPDPNNFIKEIDKFLLEGYEISSTMISQQPSMLLGQLPTTVYDAILIKKNKV
jgi:hypothetical protein